MGNIGDRLVPDGHSRPSVAPDTAGQSLTCHADAKVFGVGGYSAVSSTVGGIHAERGKGGKLTRRYAQIQELLHT